uniref:methyl-accepting chemotaxis protein n=1 Tax=Aetokthonos hydrillicola TaxID=1550245 RepID=UPI001B10966A
NQILNLKDQAYQIRKISNLVSEFAHRTNVIALNSALEAERAGEYGKGFAIVAFEVSKLANQSQQSAQSINQLVAELEVALNSAVKNNN